MRVKPVTLGSVPYQPVSNTDPDEDSNGTAIGLVKIEERPQPRPLPEGVGP